MMLVMGVMVVRGIMRGNGRLNVTMVVTSTARGGAKGVQTHGCGWAVPSLAAGRRTSCIVDNGASGIVRNVTFV